MYKIILASASPRRKEILDRMGITYQVIVADVEEHVSETEPSKMVQALASIKAEAVLTKYRQLYEDAFIIIGADTMVFYNGQALGKAKNEADAYRMLTMLSGNSHEVITGVSIIISSNETERISFAVSTRVTIAPLTDRQIWDYIATGEPADKAGSYAIQGKFGIYVKEIVGDYYNVVGFPIAKIYELLLERGIDITQQKR